LQPKTKEFQMNTHKNTHQLPTRSELLSQLERKAARKVIVPPVNVGCFPVPWAQSMAESESSPDVMPGCFPDVPLFLLDGGVGCSGLAADSTVFEG
jgi:hypothetical protein